jgi:hypothetical protein
MSARARTFEADRETARVALDRFDARGTCLRKRNRKRHAYAQTRSGLAQTLHAAAHARAARARQITVQMYCPRLPHVACVICNAKGARGARR